MLEEAVKTIEWDLLLAFLQHRIKEPEWLFFVSSWDHEDEANQEVHALTVPNFWLVSKIGI